MTALSLAPDTTRTLEIIHSTMGIELNRRALCYVVCDLDLGPKL